MFPLRDAGPRSFLAMAALSVACGPGAHAGGGGPEPVEFPGITFLLEEEDYPIPGRTFFEVGRSLQRMTPYLRNRSAVGIHSYDIRWKYSYSRDTGPCRIDDVQIELSSTILMPRWTRPAGAPPEVHEAWEVFLLSVREHEDRHRELAIMAALEIQQGLTGLEAPACTEALSRDANRLGHDILAAYRERNRAFDQASPWARWPPDGFR